MALLVITVVTRLPYLGGGEINWDEGLGWLSLRLLQSGHPLFTAVYSTQPPAFLMLAEPVWALLGGGIAAARTYTMAWDVIGIGAGALIGWRLAGPVAGVSLAGILACDPRMILQSVTFQSDGPATAMALVAMAIATVSLTQERPRTRLAAAAVGGGVLAVGLMTKLLDAAAVPAFAAMLAGAPGWWRRWLAALAGGVLLTGCILAPWLGSLSTVWHQCVGSYLGASWRGLRPGAFAVSALRTEAPILSLAVLGAAIGWGAHRRLVSVGLTWLAGGMVAILAANSGFLHLTVALSPGMALLGAAGAARASSFFSGLRGSGRWLIPIAVAVGATAAGGVLLSSTLTPLTTHIPASSIRIEASLDRLTPPSSVIVGDDQFDQAAADRLPPPQLVDTSLPRLTNTGLTPTVLERDLGSEGSGVCAVLFSGQRLSTVPGLRRWVAAHFPLQFDLGGGVTLYRRTVCAPGTG